MGLETSALEDEAVTTARHGRQSACRCKRTGMSLANAWLSGAGIPAAPVACRRHAAAPTFYVYFPRQGRMGRCRGKTVLSCRDNLCWRLPTRAPIAMQSNDSNQQI